MTIKAVPGDLKNWQETAIWKVLAKRRTAEAEAVRTGLKHMMPKIQAILAQGGTAPTDFTLHDSGHAFRVAQRMAELCTAPVRLTGKLATYELALLLLSAYLHDIGMTPERGKVTAHLSYLLNPDSAGLTQSDREEFQQWLDDDGRCTELPLAADQLGRACELVTYYCRHKHNEWSEDWIRANLGKEELGSYTDWIEDLVALCRSHHFGYNELVGAKYDPISVSSSGVVVHRRFLAAILRVADIMEFDPERTPEVVFRHRQVSPDSVVYWWKDHYISCKQEAERFVITARPPDARIHRAVELMMDDIDRELLLCRRLADETHFEACPGLRKPLPHQWGFASTVHRTVEPKNDAYEYIDGAFRPDTEKLLQLLSGEQLYQDDAAAVRELLQNSFDAVKEEMAYQRLAQAQPNRPELIDALAKQHTVYLGVERIGRYAWLVCRDSGVGMNKRIITRHLLISGAARHPDVLELERRCKAAGFDLDRTGRFGVGVLSYFMIADQVVLRTRRSANSADSEGHGWCFETEGVGSFGELRRDLGIASGTEVRLRLRVRPDSESWTTFISGLRAYVRRCLVRIPCVVSVDLDPGKAGMLTWQPGWTDPQNEFRSSALSRIVRLAGREQGISVDLLPGSEQEKIVCEQGEFEDARKEAAACLRWEVEEGELKDQKGVLAGRYRIWLPYFQMQGGCSLAFTRTRESADGSLLITRVGVNWLFVPKSAAREAWMGMLVTEPAQRPQRPQRLHASWEVDWVSSTAVEISVNRSALSRRGEDGALLKELHSRVAHFEHDFVNRHPGGVYAWLNARLTGCCLPDDIQLLWPQSDGANEARVWAKVQLPVRDTSEFWCDDRDDLWRGAPLPVLPMLSCAQSLQVSWFHPHFPPSHIAVRMIGRSCDVCRVWADWRTLGTGNGVLAACQFPPEWSSVAMVSSSHSGTIWNREHPLVACVDAQSWEWSGTLGSLANPVPAVGEALDSRQRAAAWLARHLLLELGRGCDLWAGLVEREPAFLAELWALVYGRREKPQEQRLHWIRRESSRSCVLHCLRPGGWRSSGSFLGSALSVPGPEWLLTPDSSQAPQ